MFVLLLYFLASAESAVSTVTYVYLRFRDCPVVLDIELSLSAWYQKTRRALMRARCLLLLLLLLSADSRERRCAVCGITFEISCNGAETKERFCANQNTKESRRIQNTHTSKIIFLSMETPCMDLRPGRLALSELEALFEVRKHEDGWDRLAPM